MFRAAARRRAAELRSDPPFRIARGLAFGLALVSVFAVADGLLPWCYGAACALCILLGGYNREAPVEGAAIGALLFANWALFNLSYVDAHRIWLDYMTGTDVLDRWMIVDAACGSIAIVIAWNRWWGIVMWGFAFLQLAAHAGYQRDLYSDVFYTDSLLNSVLLAQIITFFLMGGRGLGRDILDLRRHLDDRGMVRRKASSPLARSKGPAE